MIKMELLRFLVMVIHYAFCGICILMYLYLMISGIVLRIRTRNMTETDRKHQFEKIYTPSLIKDIPSAHRATRLAFLVIGVFLLIIWFFGSTEEQYTVKSLLEQTSIWLYLFLGMGIGVGTLMTVIIPSEISSAMDIARSIRKESIRTIWLAIVYFVIIWLIS